MIRRTQHHISLVKLQSVVYLSIQLPLISIFTCEFPSRLFNSDDFPFFSSPSSLSSSLVVLPLSRLTRWFQLEGSSRHWKRLSAHLRHICSSWSCFSTVCPAPSSVLREFLLLCPSASRGDRRLCHREGSWRYSIL